MENWDIFARTTNVFTRRFMSDLETGTMPMKQEDFPLRETAFTNENFVNAKQLSMSVDANVSRQFMIVYEAKSQS